MGHSVGYGGGVDDKSVEGEPSPPVVRASDAERNLVAERLGTACGEGRLLLTEFSCRVGEVYATRTRAELDRLVTDLPVAAERPVASVADGVKATRWEVRPLGGVRRTGRWRVPPREVFVTLLGGMHLDLRDAVLGAEEVSLTVVTLLGGVNVIVPPGVEVDVDGFTLLGGRHVEVDPSPPRAGSNAPRLRIRIVTVLGGVHVGTAVTAEARRHGLGGVDRRGLRRQRLHLR